MFDHQWFQIIFQDHSDWKYIIKCIVMWELILWTTTQPICSCFVWWKGVLGLILFPISQELVNEAFNKMLGQYKKSSLPQNFDHYILIQMTSRSMIENEWSLDQNSVITPKSSSRIRYLVSIKLTHSLAHFLWNFDGMDASKLESRLVLVMTWCCQATSHYQSRWWPISLLMYAATRDLC